jgi:hypothetical protein
MPGFGHSGLVPAAAVSMATVVTCLWIADRLLSPIIDLERCRREVYASVVVATSLSNNVARLAGQGDVVAINALRDTRKDLTREADRLASFATRQSLSLRVYIEICGYDLGGASRGLMRLAASLLGPNGQHLMDRATVQASLKISTSGRS